jgi:hypothetical protein
LPKNVKIRIYGTIILPVILCGFESLSPTLREEEGLRVFENRVLRRIFGPRRDELTGGWRKLHNEKLHILYFSPSIVKIIRTRRTKLVGDLARIGRKGMHTGYWLQNRKERDH